MEQIINREDGEKMKIPSNYTVGSRKRKMEFLLFKLPDNSDVYCS
jgi:hypothetical protein